MPQGNKCHFPLISVPEQQLAMEKAKPTSLAVMINTWLTGDHKVPQTEGVDTRTQHTHTHKHSYD